MNFCLLLESHTSCTPPRFPKIARLERAQLASFGELPKRKLAQWSVVRKTLCLPPIQLFAWTTRFSENRQTHRMQSGCFAASPVAIILCIPASAFFRQIGGLSISL